MLSRLFEQHTKRTVQSLNGEWTYYFPTEGTQLSPQEWSCGQPLELPVPGVWEQDPETVNYRGQAVARRALRIQSAGAARLLFKGVSHTCRVMLDGVEVGAHHNAYTPFAVDIPNLEAGDHELLVWISNEHGDLSALHLPNDYYNYGGISRPAELQLLQGPAYLRQVHFQTVRKDDGWHLGFTIRIANLGTESVGGTVALSLGNEHWRSPETDFTQGETEIRGDLFCGQVDTWSPASAKLYSVKTTLEGPSFQDDLIDRIGFRTVRTEGQLLLLNDEPVFLMGLNRHEDHPDFGCAIPLEVMREDLQICRELGCNAIRTSHYPNDERFLDLCDDLGFLVWEENHARGLHPRGAGLPGHDHPMRHPRFREQCRLCNEEMVDGHFNHPSIILWGILNECDSFSEWGRRCYKEQFEQIRRMDSSRPLTYASCHPGDIDPEQTDICQDLPDICSWNFYHNWYGNRSAAEGLAGVLEVLEPKMDGKPMILSEFGAGALPGYRDPVRRAKWSEERQADILKECLGVYLHHPRLCGAFIWQFCDVRVDEAWAISRPRTMNNKGIVDERRRPKLAFDIVRTCFAQAQRNHSWR